MRALLLHILAAAVLQLGETFNAELDVVSGGGGCCGRLAWRLLDLAETDVARGGRGIVLTGLGLEGLEVT